MFFAGMALGAMAGAAFGIGVMCCVVAGKRELRNALNRLRDKYLAMGRYSDGIDSVILKVMKPNTSRRFFW